MKLRKIALWLIVLLGGCVGIACAQTAPLSASNLKDAAGNPFSGTLQICPVSSSGLPQAFHYGSGGAGLNRCASITVTNGAFTATVPDVYLTSPQNLCLAMHAWDPVTNGDDLGYICVQPSISARSAAVTNGWCTQAGACNLDNYSASVPAMAEVNLNLTGGSGGTTNWAAPGAIGATTPSTGSFTSVTANSVSTNGSGPSGLTITPDGTTPTAPTNSVAISTPQSVPTPYTLLLPTNVSSATSQTPMQCTYSAGPPATLTCTLSSAGTGGLGNGITTGVNSGSYTCLTWSGSCANGLDFGVLADSSGTDKRLFFDSPAGGGDIFRIGGTQVFTMPTTAPGTSQTPSCSTSSGVVTCTWASATGWTGSFQTQIASGNFSDWSFNGNHADGTRLGMVGGNSSSGDPNLYADVPAGGSFKFRVNNSQVAALGGNGLQLPSSTATCSSTVAGTFNYVAGASGVKDTVQVCAKDASNAYAWRTIY